MNSQVERLHNNELPFFTRKLRTAFYNNLAGIAWGTITFHENNTEVTIGTGDKDQHHAQVWVYENSFYTQCALNGSNGAAESYMDGDWKTDNLPALIEIFARNLTAIDELESGIAKFTQYLMRAAHNLRRNSISGSKKNIADHYDLSNDFFSLFLDKSMMYSSAIFNDSHHTLESAAEFKLDTIISKLGLNKNSNLIEIGSGWGGMAIRAAETAKCRVTTTTISDQQFNYADEKIRSKGLTENITLLNKDYRELEGKFDSLVSIEMVEAVGHQYLDQYFNKISNLLLNEGKACIQAITIDDRRYASAVKEVDFIKKYIFPGSFIPCVSLLTQTAARHGLRLTHLEDIGMSYAVTLQKWREQFLSKLDEVKQLGFDDRFIRMWDFYLCYCEGGFRAKSISNVQLVFEKHQ